MDKNLISVPEFQSKVLASMNRAYNTKDFHYALENLISALERVISDYRILKKMPRRIKNKETGKTENGFSNKVVFSDLMRGFSEQKKGIFLQSEELKNIININPLIEEMTIFSDYLVWPEDADSEIKLESQKKHSEVKKQYNQYLERKSGETKLIKKISSYVLMLRDNIKHGEKTPMSPDANFKQRTQSILNLSTPFLKNAFFELLFDYPKSRICLYGTLRTGQSNHGKLKELIEGDFVIKQGTVEGVIHCENNMLWFFR